MGAAAQFDGEGLARPLAIGLHAHGHHADLVAIFLAKERARARLPGVIDPHEARLHGAVLQHHAVGDLLDLRELAVADGLGMGEIEAQPVGGDQRALLGHMIAQHLAQGLVQQMGGRMVGADGAAAAVVHLQLKGLTLAQGAQFHRHFMDEEVAQLLLRIGDEDPQAHGGHHAHVADLAARFAIERRLVEHDQALLPGLENLDLLAAGHQRAHHALGALGLVAQIFGRAHLIAHAEPDGFGCSLARTRPGLAGLGPLAFHGLGESVGIHAHAPRAQGFLGQIQRETIGVIELEGGLAIELLPADKAHGLLVKNGQAARQGDAKARLLQPEGLADERLGAHEFGIGLAHFAHQHRHQAPHERVTRAQ